MNITEELKAKYISFILNGYNTKKISEEINIPWSTVKGHFRKLKLETIHKPKANPLNKETLIPFLEKGYSANKIAKELNRSACSVKYWLKKNLLHSSQMKSQNKCAVCGSLIGTKKRKYCSLKCRKSMITPGDNRVYQNQLDRGLDRKKLLIEMKGGKCNICGYMKNYAGLTFHHVDPTKKEFGLDVRKLSNRSWKKILKEAGGCMLLCHNCHQEIHHPHLNVGGPTGLG